MRFSRKKLARENVGENEASSLAEEIENACEGLFYLSETDAEIIPFFGGQVQKSVRESIVEEIGTKGEVIIEETTSDAFFTRLTAVHDWCGETEKNNAKRSLELEKLLKKNLKNLTVVRVGRVQVDIYVAGIDPEGNLAGIKTKAVET